MKAQLKQKSKGVQAGDLESQKMLLSKKLALERRQFDELKAVNQGQVSEMKVLNDRIQEIESEQLESNSEDNPQMRTI